MFLPHPFITYLAQASHIILHQCSLTLNVRSHMQNANQLNYSWLPPTVEPILLFVVFMEWTLVFWRANKHWFCEKKWWIATIFNCFVFFITGLSFVCCCFFCLVLFLFSGKGKRTYRTEESPFPCVQLWGRTGKKDDVMLRVPYVRYTRKECG